MLFETVILGGGPAGTGALVWAARNGLLSDWLDAGVALVETRSVFGGTVGQYQLNADTLGGTFLECLSGGNCEDWLCALRAHPVTVALSAWEGRMPPLRLVGVFLRVLCAALAEQFSQRPFSRIFPAHRAESLHLLKGGGIAVATSGPSGERRLIEAASAVMALGGRQRSDWRDIFLLPGVSLDPWRDKIIPSDALLSGKGAAKAIHLLRSSRRAIVLGGAHSAFSSAWYLLERLGVPFGTASVQILHRSSPRVFYPSREDALRDNYPFQESDVCPATGRVFRLSGLRGDGRQIYRRISGLGDAPPEPRALARPLGSFSPAELRRTLEEADVIVPAFGYRMAVLPVFDADGRRVPLAATGPCVGPDARILTADGESLPNVFGIGLGSSFRPWGAMAGEPSFRGQQNSLWLYQNGLGELIYRGVRDCAERRTPRVPEPLTGVIAA